MPPILNSAEPDPSLWRLSFFFRIRPSLKSGSAAGRKLGQGPALQIWSAVICRRFLASWSNFLLASATTFVARPELWSQPCPTLFADASRPLSIQRLRSNSRSWMTTPSDSRWPPRRLGFPQRGKPTLWRVWLLFMTRLVDHRERQSGCEVKFGTAEFSQFGLGIRLPLNAFHRSGSKAVLERPTVSLDSLILWGQLHGTVKTGSNILRG